jgi:hypothetical protein
MPLGFIVIYYPTGLIGEGYIIRQDEASRSFRCKSFSEEFPHHPISKGKVGVGHMEFNSKDNLGKGAWNKRRRYNKGSS